MFVLINFNIYTFLVKEKWYLIDPKFSFESPPKLYQHTAVVMENFMYVYGGLTGVIENVYIFFFFFYEYFFCRLTLRDLKIL
jgi:hypothetical protein